MNKQRIFVSDVLPCAGDLCVVFAVIKTKEENHTIQICLPKSCGIDECVGKEIYYEMKNGKVRISKVRQSKSVVDIHAQDVEGGEE